MACGFQGHQTGKKLSHEAADEAALCSMKALDRIDEIRQLVKNRNDTKLELDNPGKLNWVLYKGSIFITANIKEENYGNDKGNNVTLLNQAFNKDFLIKNLNGINLNILAGSILEGFSQQKYFSVPIDEVVVERLGEKGEQLLQLLFNSLKQGYSQNLESPFSSKKQVDSFNYLNQNVTEKIDQNQKEEAPFIDLDHTLSMKDRILLNRNKIIVIEKQLRKLKGNSKARNSLKNFKKVNKMLEKNHDNIILFEKKLIEWYQLKDEIKKNSSIDYLFGKNEKSHNEKVKIIKDFLDAVKLIGITYREIDLDKLLSSEEDVNDVSDKIYLLLSILQLNKGQKISNYPVSLATPESERQNLKRDYAYYYDTKTKKNIPVLLASVLILRKKTS